ncbi:MAG TPA: hypothetical protein VGD88_01400 [Opitutaceae bacterium]
MNTRILLSLGALVPAAVLAQPADRYAGERPPVSLAAPAAAPAPAAPSEQRLYAPAATLIAPEKAQQVVEAFRAAYAKLGSPRMIIAVNRELVDSGSGLQLTGRKEKTESTRSEYSGSSSSKTDTVKAENTYTAATPAKTTLADRQTVRDIERLFGRPLRVGGAKLADQRVAAQLIADRPTDHFLVTSNDAARKDREALEKVADVMIEVLITSRPLVVPGISGDENFTVPDIQVTAVRLADGAIIGQATARDVMGKDRDAGHVARSFDVSDIAEATALALMEDITVTTP